MNKSRTTERNMYFYVSGERCTEGRIIFLNSSLYLQEDTSPWSWRLRTAQVSYCFHICSYLLTELISVFTVFGAFRTVAKSAFLFLLCSVLFVAGPAHILCLTVASGCNKERCIPEILPLLCPRHTHCFNSRIVYLIGLKVFATFLSPRAIIWLQMNFVLKAITEIFKTSDHKRIFLKVCIILYLSQNF